jgi:hypothetical protein
MPGGHPREEVKGETEQANRLTRWLRRIQEAPRSAVRITFDTADYSYEQALAKLNAAYGMSPESSLGEEDLGDGWTETKLLGVIETVRPAARAVLRFVAEHAPTVSAAEVNQHFSDHVTHPLTGHQLNGVLTNLRQAARGAGANSQALPHRDAQRRYILAPPVAEGVLRAFAVFDARG